MAKPFHLLAIYAHPDDEAFGAAGTLAAFTDNGNLVTLICATRGEVGEISDPALATPETLAEVRERELRTAMTHVKVADVRFLGYRDSGMAGTPPNDDPRAFINADHDTVSEFLVGQLQELDPDIVITFGADGVYGHPDHIKIHEVVTSAIEAVGAISGTAPALYYNAVPRERIIAMAKRPNGPFAGMSEEQLAKFGTPPELITTVIDVADTFERKLTTIRAHRTQVGVNGPWAEMAPEEVRELMRYERFRLMQYPWSLPGEDLLATITTSMVTATRTGGQ